MSTPLPRRKVAVVCIIVFCEAFNNFVIFPFLPFMIVHFGLVPEVEQSGYYAGLLGSCFNMAQFFSGPILGNISDSLGRRPMLLLGTLASSVSALTFGFATSFPMAILLRCIAGFLSGNVVLGKTYMAEITDASNQTRGFSLLGPMFGLGLLLAPFVGGILADPAGKYPDTFGGVAFFQTFPYFLPTFVGGLISLSGFILGLFALTESPVFLERKLREREAQEQQDASDVEMQDLSGGQAEEEGDQVGLLRGMSQDGQGTKERASLSLEEDHSSVDLLRLSDTKKEPQRSQQRIPLRAPFWRSCLGSLVCMVRDPKSLTPKFVPTCKFACIRTIIVPVLMHMFISFQMSLLDELFPLWAAKPVESGGVGFDSSLLGLFSGLVGMTNIVLQLFAYVPLSRRLSHVVVYRIGMSCSFVLTLSPMVNWLSGTPWLMYTGMGLVFMFRAFLASMCFTAAMILVAAAVTEADKRGAINGFAQSITSSSRTLGPLIAAPVFAWSSTNGLSFPLNQYLMFLFLGVTASGALFVSSLFVPPPAPPSTHEVREPVEEDNPPQTLVGAKPLQLACEGDASSGMDLH